MRYFQAKALVAGAALAVAAMLAAGPRDVAANPMPCKWVSVTVNPGQTFKGKTCNWKYGCDCRIRSCLMGGRWVYRGAVLNCINLPG